MTFEHLRPTTAIPPHPNVPGLALTWAPAAGAASFWAAFDQQVLPTLREAHQAGLVSAVLPYEHRAVSVAGHGAATWTIAVVVVGKRGRSLGELTQALQARADALSAHGALRSADMLTMQPNLDVLAQGRPRLQWLEYVVSKPATRELYYTQQYTFSGPAMRRLSERHGCQRFVGFEVTERRFTAPGVAAWDVLHISGFGLWQTLAMLPRFHAAAQAQAAVTFREGVSARDVLRAWNQMRTKTMVRARQQGARTLEFTGFD